MNERTIDIQFLGTGDAFGGGGRLQSCILLDAGSHRMLLDCGPSVLIALNRFGVPSDDIDAIVLSHLHGDHFGGVPFFLLESRVLAGRTRPLSIAGPQGLESRIRSVHELLFPGTLSGEPPFPVEFIELPETRPAAVGESLVTAYRVPHMSDPPSYAVRVQYGDKIVAYSGDTEWTDELPKAARGADLFICESNNFEAAAGHHLDYQTIAGHIDDLGCKRIVLTHMGEDMLRRAASVDIDCARDGMLITV
ncbi:MAG: MBL fold metallo-hydrolase [Chitinivibrionia bacterium]|nr:MBL fold metallo-hydrolase [Chitinivibrionia bacterium]